MNPRKGMMIKSFLQVHFPNAEVLVFDNFRTLECRVGSVLSKKDMLGGAMSLFLQKGVQVLLGAKGDKLVFKIN
jgi:hypothetical protein